jgi:hypothetical protein
MDGWMDGWIKPRLLHRLLGTLFLLAERIRKRKAERPEAGHGIFRI